MEPTTGIEPVNLFLTKEALYRLSYVGTIQISPPPDFHQTHAWSGRRGSNSRHSAWKAEALPTELLPPDAQHNRAEYIGALRSDLKVLIPPSFILFD